MRTLAEVLPVEVAIGCTVNCQASAIIYRVLKFMAIIFFYQFIRRVLVTLSNPNSNLHHRALNNTTDYGYYWFGVTMEPSVSIPSCSGKHHSEQHPLLHSSSRDDPHRAWSIFRSTCSGRGRTKLGKEVVALRCVVEVVVEMKEEKGEIV